MNAPRAPSGASNGPDDARCDAALAKFVCWLERAGPTGYDQYDFWATRYGVWAKGLYHRRAWAGGPFVAPLVAADWLWPSSRRWFCATRRFPIADANYLMGFAALYRVSRAPAALEAAAGLADALLASALPGFSGPCWGYPFDWQTRRGLWRRGTPLVTTTPYAFDAFLEMHELTGDPRHRDVAIAIANFVARDIRDTPVGSGCAASYTPFDDSQVVNASAYRAACMADASRLADGPYRALAAANLRFVVEQQRGDGAWPYSANDPGDTFVDHFHTCFVLKGLYRAYRVLGDRDVLTAIERGYDFYRRHLFDADGRPRPFCESDRPQLAVHELYDHAEALNLALLLASDLPTAELADRMAQALIGEWQMPEGCFRTRTSRGGIENRVPYHRWGQAQAFRALARYREARSAP